MELKLVRTKLTTKSTIGKLYIDDIFYCYTLEDTDRGMLQSMSIEDINKKKVYGVTAIPRGTYEVIVNMSSRFKVLMPLLLNVKGYEGVRIHKGNIPENTLGCILVGMKEGIDCITESKLAYDFLLTKINKAIANKQEITLTIE